MSSEIVEVTWEVEDGYVGGSRPQHTGIFIDDLVGLSDSQIEDAVWDETYQDFQQVVTHWITEDSVERVIAAVRELEAAQASEEEEENV